MRFPNRRYLYESCFTWKVFTGNRPIPGSIAGAALLQVLFTYAPFMNAIFGNQPLP